MIKIFYEIYYLFFAFEYKLQIYVLVIKLTNGAKEKEKGFFF